MTEDKFGIGVDIENIDRFKRLYPFKKKFLNKIFTKRELEYCLKKNKFAHHLAVRYAGKEAVIKALSKFYRKSIFYKDIEITNSKKGFPICKIKRKFICGLNIKISLSHCKDKAIAFVIINEVKKYGRNK